MFLPCINKVCVCMYVGRQSASQPHARQPDSQVWVALKAASQVARQSIIQTVRTSVRKPSSQVFRKTGCEVHVVS